jgi:transposase
VYLLNPAYVKAHGQSRGQRGKTDRIDAALIADYLATHRPDCEPWQPLPSELEELRELMRLYNDVRGAAASLGQRRAGLRTSVARALQEQIAKTVKQFAQRILKAAREHARRHVSLARPVENLQTIKGVGEISALTFVAELPRGRAARSVAAWAGVTPRPYESGTSVRKRPKLCKQGSDYVRQSLYWPAVTALRCNPVMQEFARRLEKSGHNKMQRVGAAMHKLVRWASAIIHNGQPFDPARTS